MVRSNVVQPRKSGAGKKGEAGWIRRRRALRTGNRRFRRKGLLFYQGALFLVGLIVVILPSIGVLEMTLGPSSEDSFRRKLEDSWQNATPQRSLSGGEFPEDFFTMEQRRSGAIFVHIFVIFYTFIGLAIVCDEYFESSLEAICENLKLKEDVAGATFMAAGGSAPELFSSIIGVFVAKSDIGFGTIVGSATFNVLFVIAMCAFITYNLELSWWPLTRDCSFYCCSILVLVYCVIDKEITSGEAAALLFMYALYITVMYFNERLEVWVGKQLVKAAQPRTGPRLFLARILESESFNYFVYGVIIANMVVIIYEAMEGESPATTGLNDFFSVVFVSEMVLKCLAYSFFGYWHDPINAFDGTLVVLILIELFLASSSYSGGLRGLRVFVRMSRILRIVRLYYAYSVEKIDAGTQTTEADFNLLYLAASGKFPATQDVPSVGAGSSSSAAVAPMPPVDDFGTKEEEVSEPVRAGADAGDGEGGDDDDDDDDDGPTFPFEVPDGGKIEIFMWALSLPLSAGMYFTIPDCRRPMFKKFYFGTFIMCIVWIAALAYVMIWMATVFGATLSIPDPVMGLTLIAAGTSIPDLLSSMAVARRGFGDMAVSSSVGSNIFDILIGLPVPWFMSTAIVFPGTVVPIQSCGLTIMVLTLFLMVAAVVSLIHWANWVMSKRLGIAMVSLYGVFMAESLLLEYNVLGDGC